MSCPGLFGASPTEKMILARSHHGGGPFAFWKFTHKIYPNIRLLMENGMELNARSIFALDPLSRVRLIGAGAKRSDIK